MSLLLAWLAFPLMLAAVGAGWGVLVELAAGRRVGGALLLPVGLAAALVVAGTFTAFSASARAAVPLVGLGTIAGLYLALPGRGAKRASSPGRFPLVGRWPLIAAIGALFAYGAPVILSGQATFTGFVKLDDTATWLNVVDIVMAHARSLSSLPASTFALTFSGDIGNSYPLGSFMLLGVGHGLTGIDSAWIFQPYLSCCGAALALCIYALVSPLIASARLRALIAFLAAQPALLYGYSLWGGIKELAASFLLALSIALTAELARSGPFVGVAPAEEQSGAAARGRRAGAGRERGAGLRHATNQAGWLPTVRAMLPLGLSLGALIQTLGIGAGGWIAPAVLLVIALWMVPSYRRRWMPRIPRLAELRTFGGLALVGAAAMVPVWVVLSHFLSNQVFNGLFNEGQSAHTQYGNLLGALSPWQIAGIWPVGDFRFPAGAGTAGPFIAVVVLFAAAGIARSLRARHFGLALYVLSGLIAIGLMYLIGVTPWVIGKSLAISSPALLAAALAGACALWSMRERAGAHSPPTGGADSSPAGKPGGAPAAATLRQPAWTWALGPLALLAIAGGVLWSNLLAYHNVTLAPRARLSELAHIGELVAGRGPTFINMYEVYADRHFMRDGAPVEPAEYRQADLPLRSGRMLTAAAWADLNSFAPGTLAPYRSIVTQISPSESRPPAIYSLTYKGRYYALWQRPAHPTVHLLEQIDYGESNSHPYCGNAEQAPSEPLCSLSPVSIPSCPQVLKAARTATAAHGYLIAYQRPQPVAAYGDELVWPGAWRHELASHSLEPEVPGTAVGHLAVPSSQRYELWLAGDFARGFQVRVDGRRVGDVRDELALLSLYAPVTDLYLSAGVHKIEYTYPSGDGFPEVLQPGSGWNEFTALAAVLLEPMESPRSELITVQPQRAATLCGRSLNWLDVVAPS